MGSIPIKIVDTFFWCIDIASTLKYNSKMQNPPQTKRWRNFDLFNSIKYLIDYEFKIL